MNNIKIGDIVRWNNDAALKRQIPDLIGYVVNIKWNHDEYEYYIHWFKLNRTRKHPKHVIKKVEG